MPPKRKRQADAEEDVTPVKKATKSKKEQLKEARARARQWAEEEAAKKKPAASTAASSSSSNTTAKRTPSRKAVTPKKSADSRSASKPAASPMRASKGTTSKKPASTSKLTTERKKAEARARAKAWAADEEAKKLSRPKSVEPQRRARTVKEEEDIDDEDDLMEDEEEAELQESDEEVEDTDMEDDEVEEEEEEIVYQKQSARAMAPRAPFSSPGRPIATKKRTVNKMEPMPPVALSGHMEPILPVSLSTRKQMQVGQDREMQEKLELERQIQAQVMNNAVTSRHEPDDIAKQPSLTQQDVVNFTQQMQQSQYQQPEYDTKRRRPFVLALSILVALGGIVWTFMSGTLAHSADMLRSSLTSSATTVSSNVIPACFIDNVALPVEVELPASPFECDDTLLSQPCPEAGSCVNGHLFSCESKHLEMASDGSRCILNEASNSTLADMEALLSNWTTQCYCDFNGVDFALKSESGAGFMFPMSKVIEQVNVDENLVSISNDYETSSIEEGELFVRLSDEYVDTKLDLPVVCWVSLVTIDAVRSAVGVVIYALLHTTSVIFGFTFAYPLASVVCLAVLLFIQYTRNRKEANKKLAIDVASVRQMAYQRLMADSLEHIVLHLRDGIAMDLHPTNKKSRSYIILHVWPRVVADVRLDNRVKKTNRLVGGKPRDVWQWVANPSN